MRPDPITNTWVKFIHLTDGRGLGILAGIILSPVVILCGNYDHLALGFVIVTVIGIPLAVVKYMVDESQRP